MTPTDWLNQWVATTMKEKHSPSVSAFEEHLKRLYAPLQTPRRPTYAEYNRKRAERSSTALQAARGLQGRLRREREV